MVNLGFLSVVVRSLKAKTVTVRETLDAQGAEIIGDFGVRGAYDDPALNETVTLTTGQSPAATLSWGDFPARAAVDVEVTDPSQTIDPETDIDVWPAEDPDNADQRIFEYEWVNDPGSDVDVDTTVSKFV